jgi:hypothetical protein
VEDLPIPFCFELRLRIQKKTGIKWDRKKRSGATRWLSEQISISCMSCSRYLHGQSIPIPKIAKKISLALNWNYRDLVKSIIVVEVENTRQRTIKKYK